MKELLSGNEAIARGAYEAGVWVAAGYPGTPSSEIIETLIEKYPEIDSEWSTNEKVAMEVALGSSIAGLKSMVTMKHVGLNVAADPLMTAAYTGVNAGLVAVVADDPGMHSSQNEQDTRNYAKFARIPLFEPSDSQEAKDMLKTAFEVSGKFDTLVLLRPVTRVSHTKSPVELSRVRRRKPSLSYRKDIPKNVMVPSNAIPRHGVLLKKYAALRKYSEDYVGNSIEYKSRNIGVITHGLIYHYVKEALPNASVMKISMYPLPTDKIRKFAVSVKKLYVVEELDPVIEEEILSLGIKVTGKKIIPSTGELFTHTIKMAFNRKTAAIPDSSSFKLAARPPVMCKGCGHIPVFEVLSDLKVTVLGDIGCYTLGALPPYYAIDTTICMGASVGNETGFKKAARLSGRDIVSAAVIGDSTFYHSGMTGLINAVYNSTPITLIILDNHITAMTGHQPDIGTAMDCRSRTTEIIDLESLVRGLGVKRVKRVSAYKKEELKKTIAEETASKEVSVIIVDEVCVIGEARVRKMRSSCGGVGQ